MDLEIVRTNLIQIPSWVTGNPPEMQVVLLIHSLGPCRPLNHVRKGRAHRGGGDARQT